MEGRLVSSEKDLSLSLDLYGVIGSGESIFGTCNGVILLNGVPITEEGIAKSSLFLMGVEFDNIDGAGEFGFEIGLSSNWTRLSGVTWACTFF